MQYESKTMSSSWRRPMSKNWAGFGTSWWKALLASRPVQIRAGCLEHHRKKRLEGYEYDSSAGLEDLLTCVQPSTQGPHLIPWRHPKSITDARKLDRASLLILVSITEHSGARSWTSFNKSSAPARNSITASICAKASLASDCV